MESIASGKHEGTKLIYTTGCVTRKNYIQKKAGQVAQAASHARAANEQQPSAASLWLGMRTEHQLGHAQAVSAYARRLQQQFPDSAEMQRYQRKAWND